MIYDLNLEKKTGRSFIYNVVCYVTRSYVKAYMSISVCKSNVMMYYTHVSHLEFTTEKLISSAVLYLKVKYQCCALFNSLKPILFLI